jgi:hypothetical protein
MANEINFESVTKKLSDYYDVCYNSGLFDDDELVWLDNIIFDVKFDNKFDVDELSKFYYASFNNGLDDDELVLLNDIIRLNYNI